MSDGDTAAFVRDATTILIGSKNEHKIEEIRPLLAELGLELKSARDVGLPEVDETGDTLPANAELKARTYAAASGMLTLADDTGLSVDALDGAPGVYSARYAGEDVTYADNNAKLLRELAGVPEDHRTARFTTAIACATPTGVVFVVEGHVDGRILSESRGDKGFGYDPIFFHEPSGATFAEMTGEQKGAISHRGRAVAAALAELRRLRS